MEREKGHVSTQTKQSTFEIARKTADVCTVIQHHH